MTDEEAKRMLARMEALAAEVETLRREVADARRTAEDAAAEKEDSPDFGGGGEPDWSGAMGRVPDGFIENPAIPPITDTTAAKDPNALQYKSLDDRKDSPPPGVTQIHDFDETPLSSTRRIELKAVTTTGTGGGRKLRLVDPDGNADFQTKWMVPLREAGTGGREIKWACIGGEVDDACQDSYGLDCAVTYGAYGRQLDIKLARTPCGGKPEDVDICSVPLIAGRFVTGITSLAVSGSNLVLTYTWQDWQDSIHMNDGQATVSCPITTCED
jgi:hypothetical protein